MVYLTTSWSRHTPEERAAELQPPSNIEIKKKNTDFVDMMISNVLPD
jgi:hypothetical protein